jgi:murein DD-endopeptidase MepM/ murein hydrolase activator NlpD
MLFTIKRPRSRRFFQLSFYGFRPSGRNKIEQLLNSWAEFLKALCRYLFNKVVWVLGLIYKLFLFVLRIPFILKSYLTKKLIWSRGKLGRPVATITVLSVAFLVFLVGEIFSGSSLVVAKDVDEDYLSSASDIIPSRNVATTRIPDERKRAESFIYNVQSGDTISGIGAKFRISTDALLYVNGLTDTSVLKIGQGLTIPPVSGLIHEIGDGDTLSSIAEKYDVAPQAIADFNYILDTSTLAIGTELVIPGAKVPVPVAPPVYYPPTPSAPSYGAAPTPSKSFCVWPTTVRIITQYFTWYHNGVDIATPWAGGMPPIFACTGGTVVRAGWDPWGLGLTVVLDHGNGYQTVYGHLSRIDVGYGQKVGRGQVVGVMGNTGRSTGPHLHFTVRFNGVPQNPFGYTN